MNILMLSWKDIKHPFKGGAEVYTHEMLKQLVKKGYKITWFGSAWSGCKHEEVIDGIKIIRAGSFLSVYWNAYKYYKKMFKGNFDIVIDQINTIPFFTPLFVKEKKISLIFQLAHNVWFSELSFPLSLVGYLAELFYLNLYRNQKTITISNSSKSDLMRLGFKDVKIVPVGLSFKPLKKVPKKNKDFTVLFVGRLKKSKRVHDVIKAFSKVSDKNKKARLQIVGSGVYELQLRSLVNKLGLLNKVKFFGFVSESKKKELMGKAHIICVASKREGWGMIVTEANACGTPAIVYNVPGLRDAVHDGYNGFVAKKNNPESLSDLMINLSDNKDYTKLCMNSLNYAIKFDWNIAAKEFEKVLKNV